MAARKAKAATSSQPVTHAVVASGCTDSPGEFNTVATLPPPEIQRFCR
ncbi:MAG TPA: hypothetical protein VKB77_00790 [Terriglobales bacterium]|nr:hypothetical protein [Terriglobales bacterium]